MGYIRTAFLDLNIVNVENVQIMENEISLGRWLFDALILLDSPGESCNLQKKIKINAAQDIIFIPNLYLEKGCKALNLEGRTVIELKNNLLIDAEINQTKFYEYIIKKGLVDNILILYINGGYSDNHKCEHIQYQFAENFINTVKSAIKDEKGDVIWRIKQGERKKTKNWEEIRKDRMVNAINDYNRYNSVIFLGAGVSASAKLPNWNKLLKNLFGNDGCINADDYEDICREMDYSNLMVARYAQKKLNITNSSEMTNMLRKELYPRNRKVKSALITAICNIINKQDKVRSVITYNYDTHIENNLNLLGKRCFSVIKKNHDESASFPVYHVHGVIFPDDSKDSSGEIVLSESDYHRKYSEVFDWSNVEQLHALSRYTCFFIGLSMKDPNLRRLLEIAKEGSGKSNRHYVFLERKSFTDEVDKCEKDFQIREDLLADLGLNVIWYKGEDNHKELIKLLKQFVAKDKIRDDDPPSL